MPVSSESYSFQSIKAELIIRKAYELINVPLSMVTSDQYDSAKNAINFILTDWFNQNVNLWTQSINFINLVPSQSKYILPSNIQKITQCFLRTSMRQNLKDKDNKSVGIAQSNQNSSYDGLGGGDATLAFDDSISDGCIQNEVAGNISYDYGHDKDVPTKNFTQQINFIGIKSNTTSVYTLVVETSNDTTTWTNLITIPPQIFQSDVTVWFEVTAPVSARYYRIRETGKEILSINKIYFNNGITDTIMSEVSRYEYYSYTNKFNVGRPTVYYVDYLKTLNIYIWQSPSPAYNCVGYSGQSLIQTLESYTESVDIPSVFYMPLVYGLAETLANQYAPEKADALKMRYNEYMDRAVINNTTEVPLTLGVYND
jgi:hypothetical protein